MLFLNFLNVCNFVLLLCSVALASIGVYGIAVNAAYAGMLNVSSAPMLLILGVLLFAVACVGFYATMRNDRAYLKLFFFLAAILVVIQVFVATTAMARAAEADTAVYDAWQHTKERDPALVRSVEKRFRCCGFAAVDDMPVPANCTDDAALGFKEACAPKIKRRYAAWLTKAGQLTLVLAMAEAATIVVGMIFYSALVSSVRLYGASTGVSRETQEFSRGTRS